GPALDPARRRDRLEPRDTHGGEPAGPQRDAASRRAAPAHAQHDRRRQLGDHAAMKVIVTGAGGMLGGDVVSELVARDHEVYALARANLDITDPADVEDALGEIGPDVVVNCAAWTDVD